LKDADTITGELESVIYCNEENNYTVAKMKLSGSYEPVVVLGYLSYVQPGEELKCRGEWVWHKDFGRQFQVESFISLVPATVGGIEKYLASGMIKGIGPKRSKKLVSMFGEDTLDIIENHSERLSEVSGISSGLARRIVAAWDEQKNIREVMIFLRGHDISAAYAAKIYKRYGDAAISILRKNPFQMADDIKGIGFKTADKIAEKVGIEKDSPYRIKAALVYLLKHFADSAGHVCVPRDFLESKCVEMIETDECKISNALDELIGDGKVVLEQDSGVNWMFLASLNACEVGLTGLVADILCAERSFAVDVHGLLAAVQESMNMTLGSGQLEALKGTFEHPFIVITGGPGTGKTTIVKSIVKGYDLLGSNILLAAPTGRAAKRLGEVTGKSAETLHRLLKFSPSKGGFQKNEENPLIADVVIVDEFSMVDISLAYTFFKALPYDCRLVIVGDSDQLPSVGPGAVLQAFVNSSKIPLFSLNKIFRQAQASRIVTNAHMIRMGEYIDTSNDRNVLSDFYFIEEENPERLAEIVVELVKTRIPKRFKLDPVEDIQVLAPMKKGYAGTSNLNTVLQEALTSTSANSVTKYGKTFRVGDKVMQVVNNYDKDVFNGNVGVVQEIDKAESELHILYEDGVVPYDFADLDEVVHAYAVTVHKAQGCEYPAVVMPLVMQHFMLLQRNLLYTAVTRAKKLLVLVGSKKALGIAIRNNKEQQRFSLLLKRLKAII